MIELILMASLSPLTPISAPAASVQPCVWPNTCSTQKAQPKPADRVEPCVWPNTCTKEPVVVAEGPFQTCVWPNKCA
jgi:hypothetical protein